MNAINERLISVIEHFCAGNRAEFARMVDVKPQTINGWITRDISKTIVQKIVDKIPEISFVWLLTGEGSMLKEESPKEHPISVQAVLPKKRIPLYDDVSSIGGLNDRVANMDGVAYPTEWIDAGDWFPEATAAIRHYGDSMIEYPSGSILALKRVEDHRLIIWGRNYSIETTEFRITKRLQDGGDDYILAYSSNESTYSDGTLIHSPIKIPKETIRHIDLVLGCVTKEYSNGPVKIIK